MTTRRIHLLAPIAGLALCVSLAPAGAGAGGFGAAITGKHGLTHASAVLQNDVNAMMHNAVPTLVRRATGSGKSIACGRMVRIDTIVTHMDSSSQWSETWTYQVCQTRISIPIDFVPDGKGGTYFTLRPKNEVVAPSPDLR
jgi:hypothetical protein